MSKKMLVAYFSVSGVTAKAAWKLSEAAGADLYEIRPEVPYSSADIDWTNKKSRSSVEMNDPASRPAIAGKIEGMEQYDVVFVGFPIWWYSAPMAVFSFLEENDLSGKRIVLFCSHGTGGLASSVNDISAVLSDSQIESNVLGVYRDDIPQSQKTIQNWLDEIGY